MPIKTPDWWYRRNAQGAPWWRFVLWPLSRLWLFVNAGKAAKAQPYRSSLKVVSIGNVTLGGSGKTPLADIILHFLGEERAVGLSKGYGGFLEGPVKVDPEKHTSDEVGDEPLMLAQRHGFWISKDRAEGLRAIEKSGAKIVIVDDAHQNNTICKDVHILVVDGDTRDGAWPFGDGGICPYGPMREPLPDAIARADLIVIALPEGETSAHPDLLALLQTKPVFLASLNAENYWSKPRMLAFAGIAKPWKFKATLTHLGAEVVGFESFPDHVSPTENRLRDMLAQATELDAGLVTTEKDHVRLPQNWKPKVKFLRVWLQPSDLQGFFMNLRERLHLPN